MIWQLLKNLFRWRATDSLITPGEECRRFLFSRNERNATGVKPSAFAPSNKSSNTSVFLKSRFNSEADFNLLRKKVIKRRGKRLHGEAKFSAEAIEFARLELAETQFNCNLKLILDESDFQNHANIDDWPDQKEHRLFLQAAIAAKAKLV